MKVIRGGIGSRKTASIGLVLGAGGVVGQAYQAGVLAALQREAGWDPREADLIVGTSAGSVTGAAMRVGVPATDLAASTYGVPTVARGGALRSGSSPTTPGRSPCPRSRSLCGPWNLPSPALIAAGRAAPPGLPARRGGHDAAPPGRVDITERARALRRDHGRQLARGTVDLRRPPLRRRPGSSSGARARPRPRWPPPSWPRAPSRATSRRSTSTASSTSTAACTRSPTPTCSRPRASTPSSSSPPCRPRTAVPTAPTACIRRSVHRRMEREIARLEADGTAVIRLEPGPRRAGPWGCGPWPRTGARG